MASAAILAQALEDSGLETEVDWEGVNFDRKMDWESFAEGERFAVVGRTGAGKSSLFQVLQGFREPSQGAIKIGGEDVANLTKK